MSEIQKLNAIAKRIVQDGLIYLINDEDTTACIIGNIGFIDETIIPRTIKYLSKEYVITSLLNEDFEFCWYKIKEIKFEPDSEIQVIDNNVFYNSTIQALTIPASLIDLKEGWCNNIEHLVQIQVMPNNPRYTIYDNKLLIGKSSFEKTNFDSLIFCFRNIKSVKIPSFIEKIDQFSFSFCKQLQNIDFSIDSKLRIIEENAFYESSIKRIRIPDHLTYIKVTAFSNCSKLEQVEISEDSELQIIDKFAFYNTSIEHIFLPRHLTQICQSAFAYSSIKSIFLNSSIKNIGDNAFYSCKKLQIIQFDENFSIELIKGSIWQRCNKSLIMVPSNLRDFFKSFLKRKKPKWVVINSF